MATSNSTQYDTSAVFKVDDAVTQEESNKEGNGSISIGSNDSTTNEGIANMSAPSNCTSSKAYETIAKSASNITCSTKTYGDQFKAKTKDICSQFIVSTGNRDKMKTVRDAIKKCIDVTNDGKCKQTCSAKVSSGDGSTEDSKLAQLILTVMN